MRSGPAGPAGPAGPVGPDGAGGVKACLVDVWQTILSGDFRIRTRILTERAGVDPDAWLAAWLGIAVERDRGTMSVADSFATTVRASTTTRCRSSPACGSRAS